MNNEDARKKFRPGEKSSKDDDWVANGNGKGPRNSLSSNVRRNWVKGSDDVIISFLYYSLRKF